MASFSDKALTSGGTRGKRSNKYADILLLSDRTVEEACDESIDKPVSLDTWVGEQCEVALSRSFFFLGEIISFSALRSRDERVLAMPFLRLATEEFTEAIVPSSSL
jgi:hypothetical protein